MGSAEVIADPVKLTGFEGEPGECALRTALSVCAITRQPFEMSWPAEGPGLSSAGLVAVDAARAVFRGVAEGATLDSRHLSFTSAGVAPGNFEVDARRTESAPILEMMIVPLALAGAPSRITITGITHAPGRQTFHDLVFGWLPLAERLGIVAEASLIRAGFESEPGVIEARVFPSPRLLGLEIASRGMLVETQGVAFAANVGIGIALPLRERLRDRLRSAGIAAQVELMPLPAEKSRGLAAAVLVQFEHLRVASVATGQPGMKPEDVADKAVQALEFMLGRRGAVPGSIASALLLSLALAASPHGSPGAIGQEPPGASKITTSEVTFELLTVAGVLRAMLPVDIQILGMPGADGSVDVRRRA